METWPLSANEQRLKNILLEVKLDIMPSSADYSWLSDMSAKIGGVYTLGWQRVLALEEKLKDMVNTQYKEDFEPLYWDEY